MFAGADVRGMDIQIEQFGHPKTLEETVDGAIDRAKQAYVGNNYGFGMESGLMAFPHSKSGHMEICVCAIYDGKDIHMGTTPACEWPKKVIDLILNKGLDGSQAMKAAGITFHEKLGEQNGYIGLFTDNRMDRKEYNKTAVIMAMMHLTHPDHF